VHGAPPARTGAEVANAIADRLRQSGQLRHYTIDVSYRDGTAEVRGSVADQAQREEALRLVQGVPGVERVLDQLSLAGGETIAQTQAAVPPPPLPPSSGPEPPLAPPPGPPSAGGPAEPLPLFAAPQPGPYDVGCPKMPPYAWPTYAPYNNYSRVAYPEAYPYNAWPFIGPVYPFPKIPLGWRAVKLEWQDGYWWFSKVATKHDWWRLRYW
jgi:BON domain-containing protein